jgi:hypothetical protein
MTARSNKKTPRDTKPMKEKTVVRNAPPPQAAALEIDQYLTPEVLSEI